MTGDPEGDRQEILLGKLALERKLLTPEQLREALAEQARPKPDGEEKSRSLGNILVQRGFVTVDQLVSLLGQQSPAPAAPPGTVSKTLGKYSLLRVVGRGGMGVVYEAMDTALDRRVALKTMHPNSGAGAREARDEEERFLREAKLSATLAKHPNIVSVYEAGVIEGKRFIAMEFIRGKSLAQWAKSGSITIRQQVGVLRDVARGVHHAHKQGVIHRDLKPENILVDAENQPHITDFGLAKMIGQNVGLSLTAAGMAMGTPAFMSPEQAQGLKSIDARTDVYSLGVMLYEILTGRRPFTGETAIEILMKAAQEPVPRPSLVVKPENHATLDAAIENICLKALAKNRDERYPTAEAFADDLTRWISGEAVTAVPPAEPKKVVPSRRPRILVGVAAAAVLLALVGAIALSRRTPDSDLARAQKLLAAGKAGEAREAYQAILGRDPGNSEALSGRDAALAKLELAESRRKLEQLNSTDDKKPPENDLRGEPPGAEAWAHAVDLLALIDPSRDNVSGTWIRQEEHLVSDRQPRSRIEIPYHPPDEYDLRVVFTRTAGTGPVSVLLARSGRNFQWTMGTGLGGLVFAFETVRGALAGINPTTSRESQGLGTGASHTTIVQVRRDSIRAFFDGRLLSQWKTGGADLGLLLPHRLRDPRLLGLLTQASSVSFERVDLLAVSGAGEPLVQGPRPLLKAQAVDGASLKPGMVAEYASGTAFEIPVLRRIDPVINFRWGDGPPWPGGPIDWFSCRWTGYLKAPKVGDYVFTMTSDEGARVTLDDVAILTNWVPHLETSNSVTVMLETGFHKISVEYFDETGAATAVLAWADSATGKPAPIGPESFFHRPLDFRPLAISASPGMLATLGPQPHVVESVAFSPSGAALASGSDDRTVRVWNLATGKETSVLRGSAGVVTCVAWSPDGKILATAAFGGKIKLWNMQTGKELATLPGHADSATSLAWAPDGKLLASGGNDKTVRIWEIAGAKESKALTGHLGGITSVAWSRDQELIASASADGTLRLWQASTGSELHVLAGHTFAVTSVAFSPDGKYVASGGNDRTVRLWNTRTGKEIRSLSGHTDAVRGLAFRKDGAMIASCGRDTTLRLWDVETGQELKVLSGHAGGLLTVAFSPDGQKVASSGYDSTIRIWEVK